MDELVKKGAVELSRLIKNGETSSEEVVKAHLERIKKVNPEINAITIPLEESALELAIKSDNASKEEKARPLHGCLLYTSPSPRDISGSRMPSSA